MKTIPIEELNFDPIEISVGDTLATELLWRLGHLPQVRQNPVPKEEYRDRRIATAAKFLMISPVQILEP